MGDGRKCNPRHTVMRVGNSYAVMQMNCYTDEYEVLLDGITEATALGIIKRDYPQDFKLIFRDAQV